MGITIHYHGKITDLDRVEEFEDRVVDMALLSQDNFNDLRGTLQQLEAGIVGELTRIRGLQ